MKKDSPEKHPQKYKKRLNIEMSFKELLTRIVRVKPPRKTEK